MGGRGNAYGTKGPSGTVNGIAGQEREVDSMWMMRRSSDIKAVMQERADGWQGPMVVAGTSGRITRSRR